MPEPFIDAFTLLGIPPELRRTDRPYTHSDLLPYLHNIIEWDIHPPEVANAAAVLLQDPEYLRRYASTYADTVDFQMPLPIFAPPMDKSGRHYPLTGMPLGEEHNFSQSYYNQHGRYRFRTGDDQFIYYTEPGVDLRVQQPWKMHITTQDYFAVEKLVELGLYHRLPLFKVSTYGDYPLFTDPAKESRQIGKTVTFYHYYVNMSWQPLDWNTIALQAEAIVQMHGGPGPKPHHDKKIEGSTALHYRCHYDLEGKYLSHRIIDEYLKANNIPPERAYNLLNLQDPYANVRVPDKSLADLLAAYRRGQTP